MKKYIGTILVVFVGLHGALSATDITHGGTTLSMDFVSIGYPGNPDHPTLGIGGVDYEYRIGTYEVTADQWTTVETADPRIGQKVGLNSNPAGKVSWNEGAKFCNWLTSGDAYVGAYQFDGSGVLTNVDRTAAFSSYGTLYVLPTEDEWVKGAYFNAAKTNISLYSNGTIVKPTLTEANYSGGIGSSWAVGTGFLELTGTYDMCGNLQEWTETATDGILDDMLEDRMTRGGAYNFSFSAMKSSSSGSKEPDYQSNNHGIRVVEVVAAALPDIEPAVLSIVSGAGSVTVNASNLTAEATSVLLFKNGLTDAVWSNLYSVTGVTETNWIISAEDQSFFRVEASY